MLQYQSKKNTLLRNTEHTIRKETLVPRWATSRLDTKCNTGGTKAYKARMVSCGISVHSCCNWTYRVRKLVRCRNWRPRWCPTRSISDKSGDRAGRGNVTTWRWHPDCVRPSVILLEIFSGSKAAYKLSVVTQC